MSQSYSYKALLNTAFDKDNIVKFITRGQNSGFLFIEYKSYESNLLEADRLSAEEAAQKILEQNKADFDIFENPIGLALYYHEYFILKINNEDSLIRIILLPLDNHYKKFPGNPIEFIDVAKYIKLLLTLCEDFPIAEIKTEVH